VRKFFDEPLSNEFVEAIKMAKETLAESRDTFLNNSATEERPEQK